MIYTPPENVIIILGMHRSGTSCLTGSLEAAGLELGDISTWNPHNIKGNRENNAIMMLNEAILEHNGGSWHNPGKSIKWTDKHIDRAKKILAANASQQPWGFKDPRTLFTLDGWLKLIPNPRFVGIYRNPRSVIQSLRKRGGEIQSEEQALAVWVKYNQQFLKLHRKYKFPVLNFDWEEDLFHRSLDLVIADLGLKPITDEQRFYDRGLLNNSAVEEPLPWSIRRIISKLDKASAPLRKRVENAK